MKRVFCIICGKCKKFKTLKKYTFLKKKFTSFYYCSKCGNEDEKIFKEEESTEILEVLGLIKNI